MAGTMSFRPSRNRADRGFCTYCVLSPVHAVKSCLVCNALLCDVHVAAHSNSAEHVLSDHVAFQMNYYRPSIREKRLTRDLVESQNLGHKLIIALQKLISNREKMERKVQSLQERRRKIRETAKVTTEKASLLFGDVRRHLEDLEQRVFSEISRREKQALLPVSDLIQKLELEKDVLCRKIYHIEVLRPTSEPRVVLQDSTEEAGHLEGLEQRVFSEISRREEQTSLPVSDLIQRLELEKDELCRKISNVKELRPTNEPRVVLQDLAGEAGHLEDLEQRVFTEISRQEELASLPVSDLIQRLELEKDELCRKICHIEALPPTSKPQVVLQDSVGEAGDDLDCDVNDLDENLILDTLYQGLSDIAVSLRRSRLPRERSDISLDVNTAANNVYMTRCLKLASATSERENRPETPDRFRVN
ncbi:uncharacterized protein ACNLHF_018989 [Anomaloglossus baeobatrachus]|uniref:uncharacterized protein LOC142310470 n=1 Tax=Anomaloglossus baeobatrachus TaxID=238106 RepID=UPI003F4F539A